MTFLKRKEGIVSGKTGFEQGLFCLLASYYCLWSSAQTRRPVVAMA